MRWHITLGVAATAVTALALLLILQMTRQTELQRTRIAVLTWRDVDVSDTVLSAGMEKTAEDSRVILNYIVVPSTATLAEEKLLAEQEIADGARAVLLEPVSTAESGKMVEELSQRVATVLLGERADTEAAGHFGNVSADSYAAGVTLGKGIAELLPDGGRIALLPESDEQGLIVARRQGIREAFRGSAVQVQEEAQGVALLVGLEDSVLTATTESAAAEEKRPLVVGVGNFSRNIYALDRGDIADMITINEFNMGYFAVAEAKKKLSSGLREVEQLRVGDTLIARDTMFSAENRKLLFPLVQRKRGEMQKRILRMLSLLLTLVLLTGCTAQRARSKKKVRIGMSVYNSCDTFIAELTGTFRENTALQQGDVQIEMNDAARSQELQDKAMRQMLDNSCDTICVNLVDRTTPGRIIDMAKKKNVPIIFSNRGLVEEGLERWSKFYYIGVDARESGVIQGRPTAAYLKAHPEADRNRDGVVQYVVLEGGAGHQDVILQTEYVTSTLRDGGIALEKLGYAFANWNRLQAQTQVRQLLTSYGSRIELILVNNDDMVFGALDTYRESAVTPPSVLGIDDTNPGLAAVREGNLADTVRDDSEGQAKAMLTLALSLSTGGRCEYPLTGGRYIRLLYGPITATSLSSMTGRNGVVSH